MSREEKMQIISTMIKTEEGLMGTEKQWGVLGELQEDLIEDEIEQILTNG